MRRGQRAAHRWMSYAMTAAIALILLLAWWVAQSPGDAPKPERLSPPPGGTGAPS